MRMSHQITVWNKNVLGSTSSGGGGTTTTTYKYYLYTESTYQDYDYETENAESGAYLSGVTVYTGVEIRSNGEINTTNAIGYNLNTVVYFNGKGAGRLYLTESTVYYDGWFYVKANIGITIVEQESGYVGYGAAYFNYKSRYRPKIKTSTKENYLYNVTNTSKNLKVDSSGKTYLETTEASLSTYTYDSVTYKLKSFT